MEIHSCPKEFNLDKYSYFNLIINCCLSDYDKNNLIDNLHKKINGYTTEEHMFDIYELENILINNILNYIAKLPCVKIVIEK